jgi:hypothetical protein
MKEAVLDFARRHDLPRPSWWTDDSNNKAPAIRQTGAPGRPTSMHLVEAEHRARWNRGEAETSIGAEANILSVWLQNNHPDAPPLTAKTIRNRLSAEHRLLLAAARK